MDIVKDIRVVTVRGLTEARSFAAEAAEARATDNAAACLAEYQAQAAAFEAVIPGMLPSRSLIIHIKAINGVFAKVKAGTLA